MTIDLTRSHIGRIHDYVLGGTYNHEADRIAAREIIARIPSYPRMALDVARHRALAAASCEHTRRQPRDA